MSSLWLTIRNNCNNPLPLVEVWLRRYTLHRFAATSTVSRCVWRQAEQWFCSILKTSMKSLRRPKSGLSRLNLHRTNSCTLGYGSLYAQRTVNFRHVRLFIFINFVFHLTSTLSLQYYVSFGGEKYVDLGLGNNRVKCRVHKDFR